MPVSVLDRKWWTGLLTGALVQNGYHEGDIIADKFRVESTLGMGGMGLVLRAQHLHLGQTVAIKILLSDHADNADAVTRFMREGQAAVRLRSEHAGRMIDVGQLPNGVPYLVMEYYDGSDLSQVLEARGRIPLSEAVDYVLQTCEAVAEAHALGIVHRDLKPANLFLTQDPFGNPSIKVLDFGISKVSQVDGSQPGSSPSLTRTATVMGSPLYMSPEQMRSTKDVDHRSDIWALGTILYELLTAKHAWIGATLSEVCVRVASDPAPLVQTERPELPMAIDAVIQKCLAKEPSGRFQTVVELARALAPFAEGSATTILQRISRLSGLKGNGAPNPNVSDDKSSNLAEQTNSAGIGTNLTWQAGATAGNFLGKQRWPARRVAALLVIAGVAVAFFVIAHYSNRPGGVTSRTVTSAAIPSTTVGTIAVVTGEVPAATAAPLATSKAVDAPTGLGAASASAQVSALVPTAVPGRFRPRATATETIKPTDAVSKHTEPLVPLTPVSSTTIQSKAKLPDSKLPAWGGRE